MATLIKRRIIRLKVRALIQDLEKQIDYLVNYSPQGLHWKKEYHFREILISETLCSEDTPPDIIKKINTIQQQVWDLRSDLAIHDRQPYLKYAEQLIYEKREKRKIKVKDFANDEIYEIEI
jgi:hypothetical protein